MTQLTDQQEKKSKELVANAGNLQADSIFRLVLRIASVAVVSMLIWMALVVAGESLPSITKFGFGFLFDTNWDPNSDAFGGLSFVFGTLATAFIAMVFAVPVGLGIAIFLTEDFLPEELLTPISFMVELLAAIPSVVYGLWGIFVMIPVLRPLEQGLSGGSSSGYSLFTAGVLLSIMVLPTVASISRDVLKSVPRSLRNASLALGATRWETIFRVMLPAGTSGIVGACVLALGRALGETMAVTMVIGNTAQIPNSPFAPGYTIAALLANEFGEASNGLHLSSLFFAGLLLFAVTLLINVLAEIFVRRVSLERQ
jgi:phosphate transport system permease protein